MVWNDQKTENIITIITQFPSLSLYTSHSFPRFLAPTDTKPPPPAQLTPDDCPGTDWSVSGPACYKAFVSEDKILQYSAAQYVCREYQSNLVSIHDNDERDFILSIIPEGIFSVWVGLSKIESNGSKLY